MNITIFGAGAYGTALSKILEANGHTIKFYDPIKFPDTNLSSALEGAEVSVLAAPSTVAAKLLFFIPKDKPLICTTKGLVSFAPFAPFGDNISVLGGGAFADELSGDKPVSLTATSQLIQDLFKADNITFDTTPDHFGVMLCGSLKNIYSIGVGIWQLEYGTPEYDEYINQSLSEMQVFLKMNGCDPATVGLSCGVGDLVATSRNKVSRNYAFGAKLRQVPNLGKDVIAGKAKINTTVEGLSAIMAISTTATFNRPPSGVPHFDHIYSAVTGTPLPPIIETVQ